MLDITTEQGKRAEKRLQSDNIAWLTTVSANGRPYTSHRKTATSTSFDCFSSAGLPSMLARKAIALLYTLLQ